MESSLSLKDILRDTIVTLACVAWRFRRAGRSSNEAAKFTRKTRENNTSLFRTVLFILNIPYMILYLPVSYDTSLFRTVLFILNIPYMILYLPV